MLHLRNLPWTAVSTALLLAIPTACVDDKPVLPKGSVDESAPPDSPLGPLAEGKADGTEVIAVSLESAHPYTNSFFRSYRLELDAKLPACATSARVRFAALRTEPGYDYVTVAGYTGTVQRFDGTQDGRWSDSVSLDPAHKFVDVRLESDESITQYGFRVDGVDYQTRVTCPLMPIRQCPDGTVDVSKAPGVCECPGAQRCVPLASVEIAHSVGGGFTGLVTGKRTIGTAASSTSSSPSAGMSATAIGTVDYEALATLVFDMGRAGLLAGPGRSEPSNWSESFSFSIGDSRVVFVAPAGAHTAQVAGFISRFKELTSCGEAGDLTCGSDLSCSAGECVAGGCMCIALYDPVCGVNGTTYSNGCAAGCGGAAVKHKGECGIEGDSCGTIRGLGCLSDFKCRYAPSGWSAPYPDAGGQCVSQTYCDAPGDCSALPHVAVPGSWACETNACAWKAGPAWTAVTGFSFVTAHPYANYMNDWRQLYLPDGATKMRLAMSGAFALEDGYDKLEVWVWRNNAWQKLKTYTGNAGPQAADVFSGRYFYLHFVSDSSITASGFSVTAQWTAL